MKSVEGVSVTNTKGKLGVLEKHYEHLGRVSVDSDFDDNWKGEVESRVEDCGRMSGSCEDGTNTPFFQKKQPRTLECYSLSIIFQAHYMPYKCFHS